MSRFTKMLVTLAALVVFALGALACGGGGAEQQPQQPGQEENPPAVV